MDDSIISVIEALLVDLCRKGRKCDATTRNTHTQTHAHTHTHTHTHTHKDTHTKTMLSHPQSKRPHYQRARAKATTLPLLYEIRCAGWLMRHASLFERSAVHYRTMKGCEGGWCYRKKGRRLTSPRPPANVGVGRDGGGGGGAGGKGGARRRRGHSLQFCSSELSPQSFWLSQRQWSGMQLLFSQRNSWGPQVFSSSSGRGANNHHMTAQTQTHTNTHRHRQNPNS